jgi:hypothetical protein
MTQQGATQTIERYRKQSVRLLDSAFSEMRKGRWSQSEELVWGSLTLAVKAVALSRGRTLDGPQQVQDYAQELGGERRDRRIREAFKQLSSFSDLIDRVRESRSRVDYLFVTLDDISEAAERLWQMVPLEGGDGEGPNGEEGQ